MDSTNMIKRLRLKKKPRGISIRRFTRVKPLLTIKDNEIDEGIKFFYNACKCGSTIRFKKEYSFIELSCISCSFRRNNRSFLVSK